MTVEPVTIPIPFSTTGTVRAIPECIAEVGVPFEGRIIESFVKAGQRVRQGAPLFSIHSPSFSETVKAFLQARQEHRIAELNHQRQQDLVDHGVGVQKELDEARLNYEISRAQLDNLTSTLAIYNVDVNSIALGKPLIVTAPIGGEIVMNAIRIGQYLTTESEPMVCVAELKKVWVVARVKENNIGLVRNQDKVTVTIDAYPKLTVEGYVSYVGKILDEQTRSLEVIIECGNDEQVLKPGMFATVTFVHDQEDTVVIPAEALVQGEDKVYVYRRLADTRFAKVPVEVAASVEGRVIVLKGIGSGDAIISRGSLFIH